MEEMPKRRIIEIIEHTIKLRKEAEEVLYRGHLISQADSYRLQREDLEFCLSLVKKLEGD